MKQPKQLKINQSEIMDFLLYDENSGIFIWKKSPSYKIKIGNIAGCIDHSNGYTYIKFNKVRYSAHRLAWVYVHGDQDGVFFIDHINHNKSDNSIKNLRKCSILENQKNISLSRANKTGFTGISLSANKNKYVCTISVNSKKLYLGTFSTLREAIFMRRQANIKYGFHKNHGIKNQ